MSAHTNLESRSQKKPATDYLQLVEDDPQVGDFNEPLQGQVEPTHQREASYEVPHKYEEMNRYTTMAQRASQDQQYDVIPRAIIPHMPQAPGMSTGRKEGPESGQSVAYLEIIPTPAERVSNH